MAGEIIQKEIGRYLFSFEKVELKNKDVLFFVHSDTPATTSFFMHKTDGKWNILLSNALGWEVMHMEDKLATAIAQQGY